MKLTTKNHKASVQDVCRLNGWTVGTRLVGDEGYGPTVIEITAIGERSLLAKAISHNGVERKPFESSWTLRNRDWREAEDAAAVFGEHEETKPK